MKISGWGELEAYTNVYSRFLLRAKRSSLGGVKTIPKYAAGSNFFSLRMHYKGHYVEDEAGTCYIMGAVRISDNCHPRNMHRKRFYETADFFGYEGFCYFMFFNPDKTANNGFELAIEDKDFKDMARIGLKYGVVDIYFLDRVRHRGICLAPFVEQEKPEDNPECQKEERVQQVSIPKKEPKKKITGGVRKRKEAEPEVKSTWQQNVDRGVRQMRRRLIARGQYKHPPRRTGPPVQLREDENGYYLLDDSDDEGAQSMDDEGPVEPASQDLPPTQESQNNSGVHKVDGVDKEVAVYEEAGADDKCVGNDKEASDDKEFWEQMEKEFEDKNRASNGKNGGDKEDGGEIEAANQKVVADGKEADDDKQFWEEVERYNFDDIYCGQNGEKGDDKEDGAEIEAAKQKLVGDDKQADDDKQFWEEVDSFNFDDIICGQNGEKGDDKQDGAKIKAAKKKAVGDDKEAVDDKQLWEQVFNFDDKNCGQNGKKGDDKDDGGEIEAAKQKVVGDDKEVDDDKGMWAEIKEEFEDQNCGPNGKKDGVGGPQMWPTDGAFWDALGACLDGLGDQSRTATEGNIEKEVSKKKMGKQKLNDPSAEEDRFIDSDYEVNDDSDMEGLMEERAKQWDGLSKYMNENPEAVPKRAGEDDSDPDWVESGDEIGSDDLHSQSSSDEEEEETWGRRGVRVMNRFVNPGPNEDVKFSLGQLFVSRAEFEDACKHHGIIQHRGIRVRRSNSRRCTMFCDTSKSCPWKVSINYRKSNSSWELTTLQLCHTCNPTFNHGNASSRYLSKRYKEEIRIMPNLRVYQLVDKVRKDLHINISRDKAQLLKKAALSEIDGDVRKQYSILRSYCGELLRTNPGSTVLLQTEKNASGGELFFRMYVCFEACKRGFKEGCRPVIGIDGCHLKGPHKGILLAAIGMDANDQIFPVAYALVEIENKRSWRWFLTALQLDLNIENSKKWTILSDKQKGLGRAMKDVLPGAEHRLCTWHMYKNFRESHPGLELKELVWAAAKCTTKRIFAKKMEEIRKLSPGAHQWLLEHTKPEEWSRAYFDTESKCDMLVNNIVECFNKVILAARFKPILTMLEALRFYFMDRLQKKRILIAKMQGRLGRKVQMKLDKNMQESNMFSATHSGEFWYEVDGLRYGKYRVNLMARTCGCRRWQLTGIPCPHAVAAINMTKEEPASFVHEYYSKNSYEAAYKYIIYPINGPDLWEEADEQPLLAPKIIRMPGRPATARKKDAMEKKEGKKPKKGELDCLRRPKKLGRYQCGRCKGTGHNIKGCPLKDVPPSQDNVTEPPPESFPEPVNAPVQNNGAAICSSSTVTPPATSNPKKRRRVQTCSLCGSTLHNKTTCRTPLPG